jgi:hypothetical protein
MSPCDVRRDMAERATTSSVDADRERDRGQGAAGPERGPSLPINGLLGGVVAVLVVFRPFATVLGGCVAGYLQGPDRRAGLKAGALAGFVALLPLLGLAFLGILGIYTVGGGALGGYIGSYLKEGQLRNADAE